MARDDLLKRYQEAGTEFIEATLARAEELFREVVRIGESTQSRAAERVEDLREGRRRGADQLLEAIRRELAGQVGQFGFASRSDLARLEARVAALEAQTGAAATQPAVKAVPPKKAPAAKEAPAGAEAPAKAAGPVKKAAKKAPAAKKSAAKAAEATSAPRSVPPTNPAGGDLGSTGA